MRTYIKAISYYVPDTIIYNKDIVREFPDWSEEKISSKIGIKQRYVSGNLTAGDMAEKAALHLFEEHKIDPQTIDAILLCTQSPDYFLPTTACTLQSRLMLSTDVMAFDFNLGCSGYVYGLGIAKGLLSAGFARNVLLITSETYSKFTHPKDRGNRALFSDAAAATLISTEGIIELKDMIFGTDGNGAKNLIVENGGLKHRGLDNIDIDPENGINKSPDFLYMNGTEIFNFTLNTVPKMVDKLLIKSNLSKEEIDIFIFHQANKHMLKFIREDISIPENKFYMCLEMFGNTVSSTIPISIYTAIKDNSIIQGQKILIAGFGVGYSWGGAILLS